MRTVSYKAIRDGAATRIGLVPADGIQANTAASIAEYVGSSLRNAWGFQDWPELTRIEERIIEAMPPLDSNLRAITWDQYDFTVMGDLIAIYDADPLLGGVVHEVGYTVTDGGIEFSPDFTGASCWIAFRLKEPAFSGVDWDAAVTYAPEDFVYYDVTGECYACVADEAVTGIVPTNEDYWMRQEIPAFLTEFLKADVAAALLAEDGQIDKAAYFENRAENLLIAASDKVGVQVGKFGRFSAVVN